MHQRNVVTDEAFYELCRANSDVKFERTATGELVVMSSTGRETGDRNRRLTQCLTAFKLPDGAERSLSPSFQG